MENKSHAPAQKDVQPKCIVCGKEIQPGDNDPQIQEEPADQALWLDGLVHVVMAGFGSRHDANRYLIAICDDCIEKTDSDGRLKFLSNMFAHDEPPINQMSQEHIDQIKQNLNEVEQNLDDEE